MFNWFEASLLIIFFFRFFFSRGKKRETKKRHCYQKSPGRTKRKVYFGWVGWGSEGWFRLGGPHPGLGVVGGERGES